MNPWTTFGVLLVALTGVAGVALSGGLWAGARFVQSRDGSDEDTSSTRARTVARTPQRTTTGGGTAYHPATSEESSVEADAEALDRVRDSDEGELRESPRGFRGRDLSDREVTRWLRRWNL